MDQCEQIETIKEHESRIRNLEISGSKILERIDNLIKSVDSLINIMKVTVVGGASIFLGFFIWYIQNI